MENHNFLWENSLFLWHFSIATLNYQRVDVFSANSAISQQDLRIWEVSKTDNTHWLMICYDDMVGFWGIHPILPSINTSTISGHFPPPEKCNPRIPSSHRPMHPTQCTRLANREAQGRTLVIRSDTRVWRSKKNCNFDGGDGDETSHLGVPCFWQSQINIR
jgi:hypothetical protein